MFVTDGQFWLGVAAMLSAVGATQFINNRVVPKLARKNAREAVKKDYDEQTAIIESLKKEILDIKDYQQKREESWAAERREMHAERRKLLKTISKKDEIIIRQQGEISRLKTRKFR